MPIRRIRAATFIVRPDREQLTRIGEVIDAGRIRPMIEAVMPLSQARLAYERGQGGHASARSFCRSWDVLDKSAL